jgi:predicted transcriptional regulator
MRAKDFITELFQPGQDINFKWSRPYKDEVNVLGKTPQGHELSINFWEITDDIVAIDFTIDADVEQDPDPDTSPKSGHELTRHGEEFAVFTQVVNAITQYLNKLPKNNVFFQVKRTEAQREPLYLKIANRVAKQLGFRHGTEQELEATNPGLYNKFDNRYSKLLWYTNAPQGVAEEIQGIAEGDNNDTAISLSKLGKFHPGADTLAEFVPERATAQYALHPDKWESTFYSLTNKDSDKLKYYGPKKISIPPGTLVGDMAIANKFYRAKTAEEKQQYAELYRQSLKPYPVDVSTYRMPELLIPRQGIAENFADGRKFVKPNFDFEWEEAERYPEFVKLGKDAWIELAKKGKAVTINSAQGINNTDAADPDSFKSLVPAKQKRALAQLEKGTVEMPIVAVYSDGHKELVGGNTRLTAMMARDGKATVWAFRVPGKQGVAETFDQPYSADLEKSEHGDYDALVQLPDGSHLSIMFNNEGNDLWQVEFWRGPSQEVTGEGDAQRIFATVLTAIQKFIKKHKPQQLTFSATKDVGPDQNSESRAKLYNRLVDRYAAAWGYDALINDLGDQVTYELTRLQPVAEDKTNNTPTIGINVRSDGDIDYASLIVDGQKKYESRKTDSLGPYVGKTVGIVRTGSGPAVAIGQVTVGEPMVVDAEKFNKLRNQHLVPQGSKFDIDVDGTKYLYPMINPVRWANERLIKHRGIVSRKIQEQGVAEDAVEDLEKDLKEPHSYDAIDHMMKTIAREEGITAKELHDRFVGKHDMTPDDWVKNKLAENFKDGKNPGRKGLSKRMGVNTKASVSALRKVAKNSSGEKQRMAHWLANMKSGRKKS